VVIDETHPDVETKRGARTAGTAAGEYIIRAASVSVADSYEIHTLYGPRKK